MVNQLRLVVLHRVADQGRSFALLADPALGNQNDTLQRRQLTRNVTPCTTGRWNQTRHETKDHHCHREGGFDHGRAHDDLDVARIGNCRSNAKRAGNSAQYPENRSQDGDSQAFDQDYCQDALPRCAECPKDCEVTSPVAD